MTNIQLAQMAISAILRCNQQIDIFDLNALLRGRSTRFIKDHQYEHIKTFGAGSAYSKETWFYYLMQMNQQGLFEIDYDKPEHFLSVTEKGHKVLKEEVDVELKGKFYERPERPQFAAGNQKSDWFKISLNGASVLIEASLKDCINWKEVVSRLRNNIKWNYEADKKVNICDYIPSNVQKREQVKAALINLASSANLEIIDGDYLLLPQRIDHDVDGNEVLRLDLPFDSAFAKFKSFLNTHKRYPQFDASPEEASLRRWYYEVQYGNLEATQIQKTQIADFLRGFYRALHMQSGNNEVVVDNKLKESRMQAVRQASDTFLSRPVDAPSFKVDAPSYRYERSSLDMTLVKNGKTFVINEDIKEEIEWRHILQKISEEIYWNYITRRQVSIFSYIKRDLPHVNEVKSMLLKIIHEAFGLEVYEDKFIIPLKKDYDKDGNEVQRLDVTFDEGLDALKKFLATHGRYPEMNTDAYETAIRKWFREVGHGIIPITAEEKAKFRDFTTQYPLAKYRRPELDN